MTLQEKIDALPEWPKEDDFSTPFTLASGIAVTYSYPADDMRLVQATLDAALARLALLRKALQDFYDYGYDRQKCYDVLAATDVPHE